MIKFGCGIFKTKPGYNFGSFSYRYADRNSMTHPIFLWTIQILSRLKWLLFWYRPKDQKSDKVLVTNKTWSGDSGLFWNKLFKTKATIEREINIITRFSVFTGLSLNPKIPLFSVWIAVWLHPAGKLSKIKTSSLRGKLNRNHTERCLREESNHVHAILYQIESTAFDIFSCRQKPKTYASGKVMDLNWIFAKESIIKECDIFKYQIKYSLTIQNTLH